MIWLIILMRPVVGIGCCDRLFGQVVVRGYLYKFGAWLMHLFMVHVDYRLLA